MRKRSQIVTYCPSPSVVAMNDVIVMSQQPLEFASTADVVLFGSGLLTRNITTAGGCLASQYLAT